ncbi:MAG: menaquinol-cytochrome c reductase cytochrome b subunit, partial [Actinomycetia bacterium]|nr:menaquinol-cytochrome c reductase cytochrome b subunit [Actinomycetes bacterium]
MTEIPEHLRKRAQQAREKAEGESSQPEEAAPDVGGGGSEAASKIPAHLLQRSKSAKDRQPEEASAGGGTATAVAPAAAGEVAAATEAGPRPTMTGPAGHTQRLLTVVKSGSIQDIKAKPMDKVHTWPHLLILEFGAALLCTAFLTIFSIFVNAPLLRLADVNATPNPSKAPWYFLGLQELLTMFHPMVA